MSGQLELGEEDRSAALRQAWDLCFNLLAAKVSKVTLEFVYPVGAAYELRRQRHHAGRRQLFRTGVAGEKIRQSDPQRAGVSPGYQGP